MAKNNEFFLFRWFKRAFHGSDQEVRDPEVQYSSGPVQKVFCI